MPELAQGEIEWVVHDFSFQLGKLPISIGIAYGQALFPRLAVGQSIKARVIRHPIKTTMPPTIKIADAISGVMVFPFKILTDCRKNALLRLESAASNDYTPIDNCNVFVVVRDYIFPFW